MIAECPNKCKPIRSKIELHAYTVYDCCWAAEAFVKTPCGGSLSLGDIEFCPHCGSKLVFVSEVK